jgi:hypothetical protein
MISTKIKKAIFFTVFDRPVYLKNSLDSWEKVDNLSEYDIYFKLEPSSYLDANIDIINNFYDKTNINMHILTNDHLMGNGNNVWDGFEILFEKYDFVILAEDDILVSTDVCKYFDYLEEKYRDDEEVAIISANTKWDTTDPTFIVKEPRFNGLIWGTWKKYWTNYFRDTWDKDYTSGTPSGWDWNLTLRVLPPNNLKTIHPHVSRSQHIGESGLHCTEEIFDLTRSPSFNETNDWIELIEVPL